MPNVVHSCRLSLTYKDCVLTDNTFALEGLCVSMCDTGSMPDGNNICVECDGRECLKGICVLTAVADTLDEITMKYMRNFRGT